MSTVKEQAAQLVEQLPELLQHALLELYDRRARGALKHDRDGTRLTLRAYQQIRVLEVAVAGRCEAIVTYNARDFRGAERFGIEILNPKEFLRRIGELT